MRGEAMADERAQWLYRIEPARYEMPSAPTAEEEAVAGAHFGYLLELKERGILILAGRTQEEFGSFGIAIFEAPDAETAERIAAADPAVAAGVFVASVHPYRIAVAREGLV
jgi:uncharacterized protein YciI